MKTFNKNQVNKEYLEKSINESFSKKFRYDPNMKIKDLEIIEDLNNWATIKIYWDCYCLRLTEINWISKFLGDKYLLLYTHNGIEILANIYYK